MRICVRWAFINQSGAAIAAAAYHLKINAPGIRTDSLLLAEGARRRVASVQLENLTNIVALYNFLSTLSGTHLLQPRMLVSRFGLVF
jgi:hypothetical protein